jgi:hypothetical protein
MRELIIRTSPTGGAGAATASVQSEQAVYGTLRHISVQYTSMPATTDVTITEVGGLSRVLLTLTNVNTSGVYTPGAQLTDAVGAAIAAQFTQIALAGKIQVDVAQGDAVALGVIVRVLVQEES